ncbi:MAG: hypothetical protein IKX15_02080, partial [Spirochaetales bacterium]|nr:hypothetical protein [Spirochaetales bacterium]
MKRFTAILATLIWGTIAFAQAPEATASWKVEPRQISQDEYELVFTASIEPGWHIYTVDHKYNPTELEFDSPSGYSASGPLTQVTTPTNLGDDKVFFDSAVFSQKVKLDGDKADVKGELTWSGCNDQFCAAPEHFEFSVPLKQGQIVPVGEDNAARGTSGGTASIASGGAKRSGASEQ